MEQKDLIQHIRKAGKTERIGEFEYPYGGIDGFFVQLAYASKFVWTQIREVARETVRNLRTRDMEERYNEEKLRKEYSTRIVQGWKGLTPEKLQKLIPQIDITVLGLGKTADEKEVEVEIPFSPEIALAIMDVSIDFENWIVDIATDSSNYQRVAEKKKEQIENLK